MKTPEEIKKGLEYCAPAWKGDHWKTGDQNCPYSSEASFCKTVLNGDAIGYIQKLESTISQVSKVLCDKQDATLGEVLQAVGQLKNEMEETKQRLDLKRRECKLHEHDKIVYMIRARKYEDMYRGLRESRTERWQDIT